MLFRSVNGVAATLGATGNATVAPVGVYPTGITLDPATGAITVGPTAAPGVYDIVYKLCDKNTPANCADMTDKVTVTATILPVPETGRADAGATTTALAHVAAHDTDNGGAGGHEHRR